MKKLLHIALLSALAFSFTPMKAAETSINSLYGKWKFTATLEQGQESGFVGEYDVTITKGSIGDYDIAGFAGAAQALKADIEGETLEVTTVVYGENPIVWATKEGTQLHYSDGTGQYPYGDPQAELILTLDAEGNLTTPDFTLVTVDNEKGTATVVAKFTNCKLTLIESAEVEITDMSGEWHFTGGEHNHSYSDKFPAEFDMTLEADDDTYTLYTATIRFEGYDPVTFENVTFDDETETMTFPFNNTYVDETKDIVFADVNSGSFESSFTFTKDSKDQMTTNNLTVRVEPTVWAIFSGSVTRSESIDFTGTYTITGNPDENYYFNEEHVFEVPASSEMTIVKDEGAGILITKLFGIDVASINQGGIPATASGDTLKISTKTESVPYYSIKMIQKDPMATPDYLVLSTVQEDIDGEIKFYWDKETETFKFGDIWLLYMSNVTYSSDWSLESYDLAPEVYIYSYAATKGTSATEEIEADVAPAQNLVYAVNGTIVIAGEPTHVEVYNLTGTCVYDGITNEIGGLKRGYYLVRTGKNVNKVILK